jgi:2',3'-cyclic-nucleotide 2'-phosphodiesterase (5'-nucleotidase family)
VSYRLLSSEILITLSSYNISRIIKPYKEFEIDGTKIAILGLTTDDMIFRWRLEGGKILDPIDTAKKYEQILKDRKNDVIIALTHIGVLADIKLAEKTKYIDLIVGGHSHSALFEPSYGINKNKRKVPVVQAGMHTEFLGRLVVDVVKGKPIKVVSYELIPITGEGLVDSNIKQMVQEADDELNASYGKDWLNGKIALSDLKAGDPEGSVKWAYFITDTMKEKANADIAIHVPSMNGENYPVGEITRRAIFNSIPRVFDLHEKFGWNIYTVKMKGVWLRVMMTALSYHGAPLTFSGLKLDYSRGPMGFKIRHITINGKNINPYKNYTVAFTEGIIKGATSVNPRTLAVLRNPVDSKIKIWSALEQRILEKAAIENSGKVSIVRALQENEHSLILL